MDGVPGVGAGNIQPGSPPPTSSTPRRSGSTSTTATRCRWPSTSRRALRRVRHRPEAGPRRGGRARDGHERVRHQLRPLERGLRGEHRGVRVPTPPGGRQARPARPDLPRERARVRPRELVPHPRQLLRLLPDRHEARAARLHRHGDPGPGRAGHPRAPLPLHRPLHVPRPRERVRGARLDGLLSRWRTDGGRRPHARPAVRPGSPASRRWRSSRSRSGCSCCSMRRGSIASACRRRSCRSSGRS